MEAECEPNSFWPCSTSFSGSIFLVFIYSGFLALGSKFIAHGSELLMRILDPGIIGGLVLPLLGALPDAVVIFVSALGGNKRLVQKQIAVGMGILAGSNVLLLTLPLAATIWLGRTDIIGTTAKNKMYSKFSWTHTGVTVYTDVMRLAKIMIGTLLPYVVIQIAFIYLSTQHKDIVKGEKYWALVAFILCCLITIAYCIHSILDVTFQQRRLEKARKKHMWAKFLQRLEKQVKEQARHHHKRHISQFHKHEHPSLFRKSESLHDLSSTEPPSQIPTQPSAPNLSQSLNNEFEFRSSPSRGKLPNYSTLTTHQQVQENRMPPPISLAGSSTNLLRRSLFKYAPDSLILRQVFTAWKESIGITDYDEEEEEEEEDIETGANEMGIPLSPPKAHESGDKTQLLKKRQKPKNYKLLARSILYLLLGTAIVIVFADPLVVNITFFSSLIHLSPFYVSFVVTPIASNCSELFNTWTFAQKKSRKTASLILSSLYGAVSMNNSINLAVFLAMIFFRDLEWYFSAETLVIFLVVISVGILGSLKTTIRLYNIIWIIALFPLSILLVAFLESRFVGWN